MRKILPALVALLITLQLSAQTLTLTAGSADVNTTTKVQLYPITDLYFIYNATTGGFEAKSVETRVGVYAANISTVTVSGLSTPASKIAYLENTHLKMNTTGGYTVLVPKNGISVRYKVSGKGTEIFGKFTEGKQPLWFGHMDSIKTAATDTTTALRLTALRKIVRGSTPLLVGNNAQAATIAAGAAAGTAPTIAIAGNDLNGEITLTTGSSTASTGTIFTVTLPTPCPNGTRVAVTEIGSPASLGKALYGITYTNNTIIWTAQTTALTASTAGYRWNYTRTCAQ